MKVKFIALVAFVTIIVLALFILRCRSTEWPERGFSDIKRMLKIDDVVFDCYQSTWAEDNRKRLGKISNLTSLGTNEQCKYEVESILWQVFPHAVNATIRCEIDGITGEYSVSVFKDKHRSVRYGGYYCSSAHFPSMETHELGSVTDALKIPY